MTDATRNPADPAALEPLEARQLMSGVTLDHGTLTITGLANAGNTVHVLEAGGKVHAVVNGEHTAYGLAGVQKVSIVGGSKADTVAVDAGLDVPVHVQTNGGADQVSGVAAADVSTYAVVGASAGNLPSASKNVAGSIAGLTLYDTTTNKPVAGYTDLSGTVTLDLAKLPKHLTIAAKLAGGEGVVRFDYDGKAGYKLEKAPPYALAGDSFGKYKAARLNAGTHTLTANLMAGGQVVSAKSVTLKLVDRTGAGTTTPVTPVPVVSPPSTGDTDAQAPDAVIKAISRTIPAGTSVHVDALSSHLHAGDWNTGHYAWDFGDAGGNENVMRGFSAAHVYDKAGTYTVTLTITNDLGKTDTTTLSVTVAAANRKVVYVSNDGSDGNSGLSEGSPIRSLAKALTLVDDNTEILLHRGDTFDQTASFRITHSNVVVGAYGLGERPKVLWTGERNNDVMFYVNAGTSNVTVENLSIDTVFDHDTIDSGTPMAFKMAGTNFTARNNELLNLQYGFMLNMNPSGVNIQNNTAPLTTGIRKYFAWVQGDHVTIADNYCANSTREHIVRCNFVSMLNVSNNDFTNLSRREDGDYWDYRKTALNVQSGQFAYLYNNKLNASMQVGPLGKENGDKGENSITMRFDYAIAEGNEVINDQVVINHGAEHITMRDNVVHADDNIGFNVDGYNAHYQRGVVDLELQNNTVTNDGTSGSFIDVWGKVDGIKMTDNLYVAPHLIIGANETAAVRIAADAIGSFTEIDGNVWPVAASVAGWVGGPAINYVGDGYTQAGMTTADEWNRLSIVGNDTFTNIDNDASSGLMLNGVRIGASLAA